MTPSGAFALAHAWDPDTARLLSRCLTQLGDKAGAAEIAARIEAEAGR